VLCVSLALIFGLQVLLRRADIYLWTKKKSSSRKTNNGGVVKMFGEKKLRALVVREMEKFVRNSARFAASRNRNAKLGVRQLSWMLLVWLTGQRGKDVAQSKIVQFLQTAYEQEWTKAKAELQQQQRTDDVADEILELLDELDDELTEE